MELLQITYMYDILEDTETVQFLVQFYTKVNKVGGTNTLLNFERSLTLAATWSGKLPEITQLNLDNSPTVPYIGSGH